MIDTKSAWDELRNMVMTCEKCGLCKTRINTVLGDGPVNCKCVIIGEAPGQEEDEQGRPFVGRAGQLLTDILEKGGKISRDSVYITNTIKCRPPGNRNPNQEEMTACNDFLEAQLALLHPEVIVTLGNIPTQWLLKNKSGITSMRGQWVEWRGIQLLPMFHPSYLLRNESKDLRLKTWQDVQALKAKLDELQ